MNISFEKENTWDVVTVTRRNAKATGKGKSREIALIDAFEKLLHKVTK